jgi:cell division protein YceG involved in septum cleavage
MKRILWFVVIFIVLLVGYIVYCSKNIDKFAVNKQITLEISKGISNKDIIKLLSEKVDLNFVCQFVLYQKVKGKNLKRGIYTFST